MLDIASLSLEEKQQLADQLAYELRGNAFEPSDSQLALWDAITSTLKSIPSASVGQAGRSGLIAFVSKFGRNKFKQRSDAMEALLDEALPRGLHRREIRNAVRQLAVRCLADYVVMRKIPPSPTSLIAMFDRLRYAVDAAFPGYIECKILHRIVQIAA